MEEKAKNTPKKKPWKPMEMAKVPLDPQQAVLSCCEQPERGAIFNQWQCSGGEFDCPSTIYELLAS